MLKRKITITTQPEKLLKKYEALKPVFYEDMVQLRSRHS